MRCVTKSSCFDMCAHAAFVTRRLAPLQATLAVSLHAPNQKLREQLVPSARVYPIDALLRDTSMYFRRTSRRVSIEYTLLDNVNDTTQQVGGCFALARQRCISSQGLQCDCHQMRRSRC